jgi:streptomycin 6-kinase
VTPDLYLRAFSVKNPVLLAETPRAYLWRVEHQHGPAVLKVLTDRGVKVGDMIGTKFLELCKGAGSVGLLAQCDDALLMEWLPGPALKDKVQTGQDEEAAQIIADTSMKLRRPAEDGFIELESHFGGALPSAEIDEFPELHRAAFARAKAMWHALLLTTEEKYLMHGDLNYDNIMWSDRGWVAIDPKGIIADPCYVFGVVFRNPIGEEARTAKSDRILNLASLLASHTGLDSTRILQFGLVHVAMSLAYHFRRSGTFSNTDLAIFQGFDSLRLQLPN